MQQSARNAASICPVSQKTQRITVGPFFLFFFARGQVCKLLLDEMWDVVNSVATPAEEALELYNDGSWLGRLGYNDVTPEEARAMHDGALAVCLAGHIPPIRPSVLCSMKHPSQAETPCPKKGECQIPGCKGNRCVEMWGGACNDVAAFGLCNPKRCGGG